MNVKDIPYWNRRRQLLDAEASTDSASSDTEGDLSGDESASSEHTV